ncbi:hypothetical protein GQ54DRAFT_311283 [Martensiomyces pterosporus]|nr:hypothetical protein GQ54DRAFT_311283 [Martensiomyces pterosporus]
MATLAQLAKLALFSGSVAATGNTISQYLVSQAETKKQTTDGGKAGSKALIPGYDPMQTARFFAYGVFFAPMSYRWHAFLNRRFPLGAIVSAASKAPGTTAASPAAAASGKTPSRMITIIKRMAVDQTFFAPFACGTFVVGMGLLEGLGSDELAQRMKHQYPGILMAGYVLWPAAQLINFSVVPLAYRVQFGSMVSLFWNTYLGWSSNRTKTRRQDPDATAKASEAGSLLAATP